MFGFGSSKKMEIDGDALDALADGCKKAADRERARGGRPIYQQKCDNNSRHPHFRRELVGVAPI